MAAQLSSHGAVLVASPGMHELSAGMRRIDAAVAFRLWAFSHRSQAAGRHRRGSGNCQGRLCPPMSAPSARNDIGVLHVVLIHLPRRHHPREPSRGTSGKPAAVTHKARHSTVRPRQRFTRLQVETRNFDKICPAARTACRIEQAMTAATATFGRRRRGGPARANLAAEYRCRWRRSAALMTGRTAGAPGPGASVTSAR